ncbi:ABC transporter permease [Methanoregula sp.]|uniref:ABC transporter permease n=1 Tax=Methanoregula sp. TaxID=2052170 RepID=UPI002BD4716C|nr:ABC transporter permease [Methanoregula sp.]HVP96741.1 ABC transporter permease [Methanoregula sp.]
MSVLFGIYALWYREIRVFFREPSRIAAAVISPVLWLLIIGGGFGSLVSFGNVSFLAFLYPGILVQLALSTAVFFGLYIVWDKKIDFLKEVLVSPLPRAAVFFGKVIGGSTDTMFQLAILLLLGCLLSSLGFMAVLPLSAPAIALLFAFLLVATAGFTGIGLVLGSRMDSPEGFQLIAGFLVTPLFFLSGALFPIDNLPGWLIPFVLANPATYAVDGLRGVLIGMHQFPAGLDFCVICLFSTVMILVGTYAFEKMRL